MPFRCAKTVCGQQKKIWAERIILSGGPGESKGEMATTSLRKSVRVACAARSGGSTTTSARSAGLLRRTPSWATKRLHQQRRLPRVKALEEGKGPARGFERERQTDRRRCRAISSRDLLTPKRSIVPARRERRRLRGSAGEAQSSEGHQR